MIEQDSVYPMEEWANIRETLHLSYLLSFDEFFFMEQHKKENGREKEENMALCFDVKISYISFMLNCLKNTDPH